MTGLSTPKRAVITLALVAVFGGALYYALRGQQEQQAQRIEAAEVAQAVPLKGLIALDVEPFFKDPRVEKILAEHKLPVAVSRVGSRDMAGKVAAGTSPDFFFPSGVVAANQVVDAARKANLAVAQSAPFHTPMVIASWEPIAKILVGNGMARSLGPRTYGVDMTRLTEAMLAKKRWKDLKGAQAYDVTRSVLVSTTDVRRSNSAAMYLALTSHALNGDVVTDRATAQQVAARLAELFKRQGYQENYVNGNFDDYVAIGIGKTPMAFIYENQLVHYALQKKGIGSDMVLLYPQPTIVNKVVFIAFNERSKALADLLGSHAQLQAIAVEYGFRVADTERFVQAVQPTGLAVEPRVTQVVDPPAFELMAEMIDVVAREMTQ
ncbi:MAG: substrate-binding domain-containing protein [Aquabacterium sp.]|nr:substrate-binding domain-containing protein [Aquabacterium sp.]